MIQRTIKAQIDTALKNYPIVVITGARQVGKSTLAYSYVKEQNFEYVSLDNMEQRKLAQQDPKYFLQQFQLPLIIDEVQYAPELFEAIEEIVNNKRLLEEVSNGLFLLTGSQTFQLMRNVSQSLAGRASIIQMNPLSLNEVLGLEEVPFIPSVERINQFKKRSPLDVKKLFSYITNGLYPELYKDNERELHDYYENYVSTYLDRDISELINLKDKTKFHDFLQYLAALTSQQINASDMARRLGVSSATVQSWLSILESSGLIYYLEPYNDASITKRIVKASKVYFSDTGLAAYLAKLNHSETLRLSNFSGAFNETFIINEIRKSFLNNKLPFNAYYYRDNNQNEIDLVLLYQGELSLIEIKQGVTFELRDVKAFKQLENSLYPIKNRVIVCNTEENYPINKDVQVVSFKNI